MNFAVLISDKGERHALIKSNVYKRCYAVHQLCLLHLKAVVPGANAVLSADRRSNLKADIHPDRERIMAKLLAREFPLPSNKDVLEGEYTIGQ